MHVAKREYTTLSKVISTVIMILILITHYISLRLVDTNTETKALICSSSHLQVSITSIKRQNTIGAENG